MRPTLLGWLPAAHGHGLTWATLADIEVNALEHTVQALAWIKWPSLFQYSTRRRRLVLGLLTTFALLFPGWSMLPEPAALA